MRVDGRGQLLVDLDERFHGVVVWRGRFTDHVCLNTATGARTAVCEFADQLVAENFGEGRRGDDLGEELGAVAGLFDARGEFLGSGQFSDVVVSTKVVLAMGVAVLSAVERRDIDGS